MCASILFVAVAFALVFGYLKIKEQEAEKARTSLVGPYLALNVDFGNPMHVAMFREALNQFHPEDPAANDSLLQAINDFRMLAVHQCRVQDRRRRAGAELEQSVQTFLDVSAVHCGLCPGDGSHLWGGSEPCRLPVHQNEAARDVLPGEFRGVAERSQVPQEAPSCLPHRCSSC